MHAFPVSTFVFFTFALFNLTKNYQLLSILGNTETSSHSNEFGNTKISLNYFYDLTEPQGRMGS